MAVALEVNIGQASLEEVVESYNFLGMVGNSLPMLEMYSLILQVAPGSTTVLVQGETGTGKELVAKGIHSISSRAQGPFIAVDSGAIPDYLFEAELFGYKKGTFTGADSNKPGLVELADNGTLFLDEVANMPLQSQAKLLRVLQERQFYPLGASAPVTVDFRLIAGTNSNLRQAVARGEFREDLYYRLNVFEIKVPSLSERLEDIGLLADHFLEKFNQRYQKSVSFAPDAYLYLEFPEWRGNVRQLENFIESVVVQSKSHVPVDVIDLARVYDQQSISSSSASGKLTAFDVGAAASSAISETFTYATAMARFEKFIVERTLIKTHGNISQAAKLLEKPKNSINDKIKEHGIQVGRYRTGNPVSTVQPCLPFQNRIGEAIHSIDDTAASSAPLTFKSADEMGMPTDPTRSRYSQIYAPPLDSSSPLARLPLHLVDVVMTKARVGIYRGDLIKAAESLGINLIQLKVLQGNSRKDRISFSPGSFYAVEDLDMIRNHIIREQLLLNNNDKTRVAYLLGIKTGIVSYRANRAPQRAEQAYALRS